VGLGGVHGRGRGGGGLGGLGGNSVRRFLWVGLVVCSDSGRCYWGGWGVGGGGGTIDCQTKRCNRKSNISEKNRKSNTFYKIEKYTR